MVDIELWEEWDEPSRCRVYRGIEWEIREGVDHTCTVLRNGYFEGAFRKFSTAMTVVEDKGLGRVILK